jgi:hypothetical protein
MKYHIYYMTGVFSNSMINAIAGFLRMRAGRKEKGRGCRPRPSVAVMLFYFDQLYVENQC